ncbi:hypothetical protein ZIOFF_041861 [Zingiber officinale]|uniref:Uncharacterized protein n=1 Tax=Zingiber officinale TaxID=94328 RepID=A0A8J5GC17_ZINOF|nr:hypothetical protein ZIOFF_041861 [Zingiber officinale]
MGPTGFRSPRSYFSPSSSFCFPSKALSPLVPSSDCRVLIPISVISFRNLNARKEKPRSAVSMAQVSSQRSFLSPCGGRRPFSCSLARRKSPGFVMLRRVSSLRIDTLRLVSRSGGFHVRRLHVGSPRRKTSRGFLSAIFVQVGTSFEISWFKLKNKAVFFVCFILIKIDNANLGGLDPDDSFLREISEMVGKGSPTKHEGDRVGSRSCQLLIERRRQTCHRRFLLPWMRRLQGPLSKGMIFQRNFFDQLLYHQFHVIRKFQSLSMQICQIAEMNPNVQFLQINYEKHKSMCYTLNVHVLPFFRFYRGAQGRLCSFSCTNATIKKFKDALAMHSTDRCSLGPAKGLDESELLSLAANKDLSFSFTKNPVPVPNPDENSTNPNIIVPTVNGGMEDSEEETRLATAER